MGNKEIFNIRQMVELTGLSEFTIRGWENRYSAFCPHRGETGRREYYKSDIERALLLRELLKRGHKIGKVAKLTNQKLQSLFVQRDVEDFEAEPKSEVVSRVMELLALQKWSELKDLFKSIPHKNTGRLIREFFLPLLKDLSSEVQSGVVSISQEHVFSSFLKEKIYSALSELEINRRAKGDRSKARFVLATPEGDHHEIGLLLAHLLIRSYGCTSLYLGPHTPPRDLAETALRFDATHLLIVSTVSKKEGARNDLMSFVSEVQKKMGSHSQILIAGSQAPNLSRDPNSALVYLGSFAALEDFL